MTANPHPRWLPVPGCVNFRDLGGYPNRDGQTIRWRRLFRSDALQDIPPDAAPFVTGELGVKLIVDLRNTDEAERDGRGPLPDMGSRYIHIPLLEERGFPPFTGGDVVERLSATYQWLIHNSGPRIVAAVDAIAIAAADSHAAVFHCSAGKDRTGVLAALILEILGVDAAIIQSDYLLTNQAVDGILRRIKAMIPSASPTTQSLAAQPVAFRRFQDTLHREYGGAEAYLIQHGATPETLARLRRNLLEERPT